MKKILLTLTLIFVFSLTLCVAVFATAENPKSFSDYKNPVTVTYDEAYHHECDCSGIHIVIAEAGSKLKEPEIPERPYYNFAGWYILRNEEAEFEAAKKLAEEEKGSALTQYEINNLKASLKEVDEDDEAWSFVGYTVTENITLVAKWVPSGEMPPMEFEINGGTFVDSLSYMGQGMLGIFVVTLVIIGVVAILNWHGRHLEKKYNKEDN